jgi:hypothetical protein
MLRDRSHSAVPARERPLKIAAASGPSVPPREATPRVLGPTAVAVTGAVLHQVPARRAAIPMAMVVDLRGHSWICASPSCAVHRMAELAIPGEDIVQATADLAVGPLTLGRAMAEAGVQDPLHLATAEAATPRAVAEVVITAAGEAVVTPVAEAEVTPAAAAMADITRLS